MFFNKRLLGLFPLGLIIVLAGAPECAAPQDCLTIEDGFCELTVCYQVDFQDGFYQLESVEMEAVVDSSDSGLVVYHPFITQVVLFPGGSSLIIDNQSSHNFDLVIYPEADKIGQAVEKIFAGEQVELVLGQGWAALKAETPVINGTVKVIPQQKAKKSSNKKWT
ncbi:MAG: hypothetical protein COT24_00660 [Candidatus Kerfeldbacteria bacterium CG08_land_8_20_14_0_20_40_16]|uniref:Uncharacterized protein n=1 Tax=Candidatus Kerfeldbacteria bacterium CG08_land_8_20_14_0_20_40_16 TaxID=2014244 RepID=A0A2H0YWW7_9BACT|nr:MAG: hypothetical protein COT24_00660 [Candidatus Kerfeldbacteria bacterium CG08_land_8_20_14_0_20_40_16]